jgi:MFS family permease
MHQHLDGGADRDRFLTLLLSATSVGAFLAPFTSTMLNLALVAIGTEFAVGSHSLGMVNTIFLLASVMVMVPITKVADKFGLKRVFIAGLLLMLLSLILAVITPSFAVFLVSRVAMGVGSACLAVTSVTMIVNTFPAQRRGWAIGVNATAVYVGTALGPTVGGFVTDFLGWRYLFVILIPISLASLFLIGRVDNDVPFDRGLKMDHVGALIYMAMVFAAVYGMINLPHLWAFALIAAGGGFFLLFRRYVNRADQPIMSTAIYGNKAFRRTVIATFMNYAASYSVSFFLALYLLTIGALSAWQSGLIMLLQPLIQILLTVKAGSLSDRMDVRVLPTAGMGLISFAVLLILFLGTEVHLWYVALILLLLGLGYGLFSAPNTSAAMSAVDFRERNIASGSIAMMRQLGMTVSMGVAMCCISVILGSTDNIQSDTFGDFILVMRTAFAVCLAMCVAGTLFSWYSGAPEESCTEVLEMS